MLLLIVRPAAEMRDKGPPSEPSTKCPGPNPPAKQPPSPSCHVPTSALSLLACRFIHASRPDLPGSIRLATAFPPKQLDDDSLTIEAAGLANSVIIQK